MVLAAAELTAGRPVPVRLGTGGRYVDVLAAFRRLAPGQKRAARFRFDQHYTPLAHRVVAEALLPAVTAARDQILARRTL